MAEIKRRVLHFSTGKQIKLYGNNLSIGNDLQVGEGGAPNLLVYLETTGGSIAPAPTTGEPKPESRNRASVMNGYGLTREEVFELADYAIGLWMELKDSIRRHGLDNPKLFRKDN